MSLSRLTDEEIAGLLQEVAEGAPMEAVCDSAHVSIRTFYRWKQKFAGLTPAGVRQLKALSAENRELRRLLAQTSAASRAPCSLDLVAVAPAAPKPARPGLPSREAHGLGVGRFAAVRLPAPNAGKIAR